MRLMAQIPRRMVRVMRPFRAVSVTGYDPEAV